ncbi:MAG TPA: chemotaxis response regulator protein-glutamate methylesterase [Blastocatellia bacterium]|jgi:two-component system chemotaxis response regulator CheB|nr:chemotaxis response regulator protein-glutamate methylesterase [Blastocatellia bacterium]
MQSEKRKIRVLVVDDSAVMRKMIPSLLEKDGELEVVATAIDGDFALNKIDQLKPDVVTLDIDMPRMDGLTALSHIVSKHAIPVIMLSSLTTRGAALTMKALEIGAVDFICKPKAIAQVGEMAGELVSKIKAAARHKIVPLSVVPAVKRTARKKALAVPGISSGGIVAIGASSGGPHALRYMLPRIPTDFGAGIVIVQHMPESFTAMFAQWLDEICDVEVKEARDGDVISPGTVLIAPGNAHLRVRKRLNGGDVTLEKGRLVNGHMPSVDVLFKSVADEYGAQAIAVLMTGMGSDGADGLGLIKQSGGRTIAQDKDSCAIFGMPRVAIEKGYAEKVVPLADLASYLISAVGKSDCLEVTGYGERR